MHGGSLLLFFALVLFFPLPSDQIGGGFLVCYFFLSFSSFVCVFGCSDDMEREACVCDHGFERSDLCAEIIIIIIIIDKKMNEVRNGEQKERKYLCFEMFYGGQKLHEYFRSLLIKDTSLLTC